MVGYVISYVYLFNWEVKMNEFLFSIGIIIILGLVYLATYAPGLLSVLLAMVGG
jgi:hypothetical protein